MENIGRRGAPNGISPGLRNLGTAVSPDKGNRSDRSLEDASAVWQDGSDFQRQLGGKSSQVCVENLGRTPWHSASQCPILILRNGLDQDRNVPTGLLVTVPVHFWFAGWGR